ncbi:LPS export ABC transporter periplasmic protein LptC [Roseovarius sp. MBR-154]
MKILLPLAALSLLSTVFLISETVDPSKSIPIAQVDLEKRAGDPGFTNPIFAGVTNKGDEIRISAAIARPGDSGLAQPTADHMVVLLRLRDSTTVTIRAERAEVTPETVTAELRDGVRITTSTGYVIETDRLEARFDTLRVSTSSPLSAHGRFGRLSAGGLLIHDETSRGEVELLFTGGVKLVYRPEDLGD